MRNEKRVLYAPHTSLKTACDRAFNQVGTLSFNGLSYDVKTSNISS